MAIEYLGLSEINGPLVVLEGVKNAERREEWAVFYLCRVIVHTISS